MRLNRRTRLLLCGLVTLAMGCYTFLSISLFTTTLSIKSPTESPVRWPIEAAQSFSKGLPWFFSNGTERPRSWSHQNIWPGEAPAESDRIIEQLMFFPKKLRSTRKVTLYHGKWRNVEEGNKPFAHCPVNACWLSSNREDAEQADAIIFRDTVRLIQHFARRPEQIWVLYMLESPIWRSSPRTLSDCLNYFVNWTATYRHDSDLVTPYERWVPYSGGAEKSRPARNYAANKTRKVAWLVSNCWASNNRMEYALELRKHIEVDIYGRCDKLRCLPLREWCFEMLERSYKFYLAFENADCWEYITEKFFANSLNRNMLPVVMGARPQDYARAAPPNSYLHVDDFESPAHLARYLHLLDTDDHLYNSYFAWKGTGEFINTHFFCRLCALLHSDYPTKWYPNINRWWNPEGVCTHGTWNVTVRHTTARHK